MQIDGEQLLVQWEICLKAAGVAESCPLLLRREVW